VLHVQGISTVQFNHQQFSINHKQQKSF